MNKYNSALIINPNYFNKIIHHVLDKIQSGRKNIFIKKVDVVHLDDILEKNSIPLIRKSFDIVFLVIQLPCTYKGRKLSYQDIGDLIVKLFPGSKIFITTEISDNYIIMDILKKINPDGLITDINITQNLLINNITKVLNSQTYYDINVIEALRKYVSNKCVIDEIDTDILLMLSKGIKMKDLPGFIPMSMSGIEKRKFRLREQLNVKSFDDKSLLKAAKDKGLIYIAF